MSKKEILVNCFQNNGFSLSDFQADQFIQFYDMLIEKNKVMNLTAITDFEDVVEKHFLDSISLSRVIDLSQKLSIMDLGTGAGFPGVPLKILYPQLNITLADSLNKRICFLNDVIETLKLNDIDTVHERAEDLAHNTSFREQYDICVSRAVANLSVLAEYCLPFVKMGGIFVAYKSEQVEEEISSAKKSIQILGGKIVKVDKFHVGDNARSFIVITKVMPTPKKFPRKAGTPSKEPL